jgi:hypothetical protein
MGLIMAHSPSSKHGSRPSVGQISVGRGVPELVAPCSPIDICLLTHI